jgi:broad specificity phosphatase PhoE
MIGQPYPPQEARREIVFIRHAESQANVDGVWNGKSDGPLSETGEASLEVLGRRLSTWEFDAVISSPLSRAVDTAKAFTEDLHIEEDFIEVDLGRWEGLHFSEVQERYGEELRKAIADRTIPMGETGESLEQAGKRAVGAVDGLFQEMSEGARVAVVTHGGFMQAVLHRHLAGESHRAHAFTSNTGITRIIQQFGRPRLASFNDTGHFGPLPSAVRQHLDKGDRVIVFVRHGQTQANVERRWQGRGDWDLDEVGMRQVESLSEWYGRHSTVYTSPLKRATSTAKHVALNGVVPVDGLMEINMGEWEGLTTEEIVEGWPEVMETIYRRRVDLPRGVTGESWADLTERMVHTVEGLTLSSEGPTVVVAHGGAIRSYISSLTKTDDRFSESLYTPRNTSVTHVALTERGPEILDYGVATHLESIQ